MFLPAPKIDSGLVRIDRRASPAVDPELVSAEALFTLVRAGFAQRRKMLRRALVDVVQADEFIRAHIDSTARAEELSVEDWGRLAIEVNRSTSAREG